MSSSPRLIGWSLLLGLGLTACQMSPAPLQGDGVFTVPSADPERHHLRFVDGQVSRNDTCMVRLENGLNPRVPPLYVNGEPVGFC